MSNIAATLSLNVPAITALCKGPRGSLFYAASGLPTNPNNIYSGTVGVSGDYYIDTSTSLLYGPFGATWPTTPLFALNLPVSAYPIQIIPGTTSLVIPTYGSNSISQPSSYVTILGGFNNSITGLNSFVLGSNITAAVTGFTLLNNLSSTGTIFASAGNSNQWYNTYTAVSPNSGNWFSTYTSVGSNSGNWNSTYTSVGSNSGNWNNTYSSVFANSGCWSSAYSLVSAVGYQTYYANNSCAILPFQQTNFATGTASNIGGGNCNNVSGCFSGILNGVCNTASGNYSNITGGFSSNAIANYSNVAGGVKNTASGYGSTIGGGIYNIACGYNAAVAAGAYNCSNCCSTFIGGGKYNTASGIRSAVVAGQNNTASGHYSYIAAGSANDTKGYANTFILGTGLSATQANYTYINNLSVQGSISVNGGINTGGTGGATFNSLGVTNNATVGGTLSSVGAATLNSLNVTNSATVSGTLKVAGASTLASLGVTNNATVGGTLGVTSNATVGGTLGVTSNATVGGSATITGSVGIGSSGSSKLNISRNVGNSSTADIHTTDGTQWIDINSNQSVGSWNPLTQNNDASVIYSAGTIDNASSALVIGPHASTAKGIRIDNNGNVGIGIAVPNSKLTVAGTISATTAVYANGYLLGSGSANSLPLSGGTLTGGLSAPSLSANSIYSIGNQTVMTDGSNTTGAGAGTISINYQNGAYIGSNGSGALYALGVSRYGAYLVANGTAFGPTGAAYFTAAPTDTLVSNGVYEYEAQLTFQKTTSATVTTSLVPSVAAGTSIAAGIMLFSFPSYSGTTTLSQTISTNAIVTNNITPYVLGVTPTLISGNYMMKIKGMIVSPAGGTTIQLNMSCGAGTITPLAGSYRKLTRIA